MVGHRRPDLPQLVLAVVQPGVLPRRNNPRQADREKDDGEKGDDDQFGSGCA
jgi:hypothetical protein